MCSKTIPFPFSSDLNLFIHAPLNIAFPYCQLTYNKHEKNESVPYILYNIKAYTDYNGVNQSVMKVGKKN